MQSMRGPNLGCLIVGVLGIIAVKSAENLRGKNRGLPRSPASPKGLGDSSKVSRESLREESEAGAHPCLPQGSWG